MHDDMMHDDMMQSGQIETRRSFGPGKHTDQMRCTAWRGCEGPPVFEMAGAW